MLIRGAEEAHSLGQPTTLTGSADDQTGTITGAALNTPTVKLTRYITSPIPARVDIDAVFSMAAPAVGALDPEGNVVVTTKLNVDLHIDVRPPEGGLAFLSADCRATPVSLDLVSVAPYDPDTGRVTLSAPNFTIPAVSSANPCGSLISGPVNDELSGAGHSLRLTLQGGLTLPPLPGDPSTTTLTVTPEGGSRLGDPVTLTATVTPGEGAEADEAPAGFVDFYAGSRLLGTVVLEGGTAQIATSGLAVGSHQLRARYRGQDPYRASAGSLDHTVSAAPLINLDLPTHVIYKGEPAPFDVEVSNTTLGSDVANAQLVVTISREKGTGALTPNRVVLERLVGDTWEPVTTTQSATRVVSARLGVDTGFPLAVGSRIDEQLRLSFPDVGATVSPTACGTNNPTCPGPFVVAVEAIQVDPTTGTAGATLARTQGSLMLIEAERRVPTLTLALGGNPLPRTTRQGRTVDFALTVGPTRAGVAASGTVDVKIDGVPVLIRANSMALSQGYVPRLPLTPGGAIGVQILLPPHIPLGLHQLTITYSGDSLFQPGVQVADITVRPAIGSVYECTESGFTNTFRFGVNVLASAMVPSIRPAGSTLDLRELQMKVLTSRLGVSDPIYINSGLNEVGGPLVTNLGFEFGPGGSGQATAVERTGGSRQPADPYPAPDSELDQVLDFKGETGEVPLDGAPGDRVEVTVDTISIEYTTGGIPRRVWCEPVGEPASLGSVTLAGVDLTVDSDSNPVRAGDEVTLSSTIAPALPGTVEFLDGDQTIGMAPVATDGTATYATDALGVGSRSLTARFHANVALPILTSNPIPVTIWPELDCETYAQEGHGAVVRLVFIELLGRCPDQAGYDYWTGQLSAGTSPERFARSIARTPEAVGRVVDDAYLTMLGRRADAAGRAFWVGRLAGHGRYDTLLADLGASGEFWSLSGSSNAGFVTRVYGQLLGRSPDQVGLDYWVGRLDAGASRRALIASLANLDEPLGVIVAQSYDEILGRMPTGSERRDGITFLRSSGDRSGLYARLIGRPEFSTRAQGFPNPED